MLEADNFLVAGLRPHPPTISHSIPIAFLLLMLLAISSQTCLSGAENVNTDYFNLDVLEGDWLTVYIHPAVQEVSFNSTGSGIDFRVSTNYTLQYRQITAIWVSPESQGEFDLRITFQSKSAVNYTIGVYSRNPDFYGRAVKFYGEFGEFFTFTHPPGNRTINIILNSHRQSRSFFHIELPTPVNAALFLATTGFIAYFNIFLICDTYFKNKKESVSNRRWLVCGIVMIISAFAIYQLYSFTTFTLSWSVL